MLPEASPNENNKVKSMNQAPYVST